METLVVLGIGMLATYYLGKRSQQNENIKEIRESSDYARGHAAGYADGWRDHVNNNTYRGDIPR